MKKNIYLSLILLVSLGFIWGSGYMLAGLAVTNNVHPLGYAFWQSVGPACLTILICYFSQIKISFSKEYLRYYFICGLLGIAIPNTIMYYIVAKYLSAGVTAVLMNTTPIMTYSLALLMGEERFAIKRFIGLSLSIIGLMAIALLTQEITYQGELKWIFIALISPLCFSTCAIYATRNRPKNSHSIAVSAGMLIASSILLTPAVIASQAFYAFKTPFTIAEWVILVEILLSGLGYMLLFQLLKLSGAVYYSLVNGVVVLTGLFWGWMIFNETLSTRLLLAIGLILAGIMLVTHRKSS
jgi:drug/metabolite transporter (DMT)-like permease